MEATISELNNIISDYSVKISAISEQTFSAKPSPNKWSKKEELGHLIDSAHNNLRRFIVGQYETNPKIVYDQNFWVPAANYQHQTSADLIMLWKLLNRQVFEVLKAMPEKNFSKTVDTGKGIVELHSLEWL